MSEKLRLLTKQKEDIEAKIAEIQKKEEQLDKAVQESFGKAAMSFLRQESCSKTIRHFLLSSTSSHIPKKGELRNRFEEFKLELPRELGNESDH